MRRKRGPSVLDSLFREQDNLLKRRHEATMLFLREIETPLMKICALLHARGVPGEDLTLPESLNQRAVFSLKDIESIAKKLDQWPAEKMKCSAVYARFCLLVLRQKPEYRGGLAPDQHGPIAKQVSMFLQLKPKDDDSPRSVISDADLRTLNVFCQTAPDQAESPPARPDSP